jgi:regulator of RNase E activity RraA
MEQTTIERLRLAGTATLATQLFDRGLRSVVFQGVRPLSRGVSFAGPARTLRYVPAREDVSVHGRLSEPDYPQRAIVESIEPGEVLVIDARRELGTATLGEIIVARVAARGAAGIVTDGAVRDAAGIAAQDLPVFVGGASPGIHLSRHHAADHDVVVGCGGVQVRPGDVVVGDADGVVCVPRELADEIAGPAAEQTRLEEFVHERIRAGAPLVGTYPPSEQVRAEYEARRDATE